MKAIFRKMAAWSTNDPSGVSTANYEAAVDGIFLTELLPANLFLQ
jgi:hypothetical protein